jgi:hypothetical protein
MMDRHAYVDLHAYVDSDAMSNLLERRWFAARSAARAVQSECAVLREVVDQAEAAWRRARRQLETLENACDVLAEDYHLHNEVRLPSFVPDCAARRSSLSDEQVFLAQGSAAG